MKYIIATTDNNYFRWQMLVQINNFKRIGIPLEDIIYVVSVTNRRSTKLNQIEKQTGVKLYTYKDERTDVRYSSSIRPHILKRFFKDYPEMGEKFFYLDPDVLFIKKLEYNPVIEDSPIWFLSDTKSYIDSKYIKSKSEKLFNEMCEIVGLEPNNVSRLDNMAGGAQYIMKNVDYEFWDKVERDCNSLYAHMEDTEKIYNPKHPIQKWTADMWAVLWNAWYFKHPTMIIRDLNFCWATDIKAKWNSNKIFHNAGVFNEKYLFNKQHYTKKSPFKEDLSHVEEKYCSYNYVQEILDTKKNYPDLINKL